MVYIYIIKYHMTLLIHYLNINKIISYELYLRSEMGSKKTVRMCLITVLFIVWEIFMLMSSLF